MTLATVVVRLRVTIPAFDEHALITLSRVRLRSIALPQELAIFQERLDQVALAAAAPRSEEAR
jgi:hypothetical protein